MNKAEILGQLSENVDVTKKDAEIVIDAFLDIISEALASGDKVVLSGFGTFEVRNRVSRSGVNPRTGERIDIPSQKTPAFKVGKVLKDKLR